jgi:hypothetical protein
MSVDNCPAWREAVAVSLVAILFAGMVGANLGLVWLQNCTAVVEYVHSLKCAWTVVLRLSSQALSQHPQSDMPELPKMEGQLVVVTGGNSGLGFEASKVFLRAGATVILACRHAGRAEAARQALLQQTGRENHSALVLPLELSDAISVYTFEQKLALFLEGEARRDSEKTRTSTGMAHASGATGTEKEGEDGGLDKGIDVLVLNADTWLGRPRRIEEAEKIGEDSKQGVGTKLSNVQGNALLVYR